jgi:hypothetical protein
MSESEPSITCPKCNKTSHHPEDVKYKYCGNCHLFHDQMGEFRACQVLKDADRGTYSIVCRRRSE